LLNTLPIEICISVQASHWLFWCIYRYPKQKYSAPFQSKKFSMDPCWMTFLTLTVLTVIFRYFRIWICTIEFTYHKIIKL
jgi:hypothetical protein